MSFPPYPSYKDSGVEWLGKVPSSWDAKRLRFVAALNPSRNEVAELPDDVELSFIPMEAVGEEGELDLSRTRPLGEVRNGYSYFADGDVVFAKVTPCLENGKGALMHDLVGAKGFGTTELIVLRPISPEDGRFLWWLTRSPEFRGPASGEMIGAGGLKRVPDDFVANFAAPWPPAQDRQSIADFLDRETAKIDRLVEAQRRLVALLKEKRQAVISHAVTKGLDPSAPLKPSSIEWLGDVPAHWDVVALSSLVQSRRPITYGIVQPGPADPNGRYMIRGQDYSSGWVAPEEIFRVSSAVEEPYRRARVRSGDLVITIVGAGVGNVAVIPDELEGANLTQTTARIAPDCGIVDSSFLQLALTSNLARTQVAIYQKGAAQPGLNLEHLKAFRLLVPPISEQKEIARQTSESTASLVLLIAEAEGACVLLAERRVALISAAVTGKIDVRGWTAEEVRNAVGAEIVHLHARDRTFGRVQYQKLLFLAQIHAGVDEIGGRFERYVAGPHDADLMASIEQTLSAEGVLQVVQPGGAGSQVTYTVTSGTRPGRSSLLAMLGGERLGKLDHLLKVLAPEDTRGVEAVATLYGVWNDALLDGEAAEDDRLVRGFLQEWHPEKADKFTAADVRNWIGFMRRNDLVPEGRGTHTQIGALL